MIPGQLITEPVWSAELASEALRDELWRANTGRLLTPTIFNTMRILKRVNPADTYMENYLWHAEKQGWRFFDQYHLAWIWGAFRRPLRILEIGTRTGISLCQLLSAMVDHEGVEAHCFDLFNDGFVTPKLVELNLKALNLPVSAVQFHTGPSAQTVPEFRKQQLSESFATISFDWILVDGDHDKTAARIDLENVVDLVAPGGILVFDDVAPDGCDLLDVWEAFRADHPEGFWYGQDLNGKGTAWAIKQ